MASLFNPTIQHAFDFRGKRVKDNGVVVSKYSMGYIIEHSGNYDRGILVTLYESMWTYEEVKHMLLEHLEEKNFDNVTIIK